MIGTQLRPRPGPAAAARRPALRVPGLPDLASRVGAADAAARSLARRLGAEAAGLAPGPEGGVGASRHHPEGPA